MIIKFLKDGKRYKFSTPEYALGLDKIKIDSADVPAVEGGFVIINDDDIETDYSAYTVPYEKTDKYIIFTSDENAYYTFLVYDKDTTFVNRQVTITSKEMENGIFQFSGQGKAYKFPEAKELFDEDGFNLYKVVDGKIINTTEEEKDVYMAEKNQKELEEAVTQKINEISGACSAAIIKGIDYGDKHFSYTNDDQKNLSNAVQLVLATGESIPYHADGESCEVYSKEDILSIYVAEETNLTENVTYHNQLKLYIQSLTSAKEVKVIEYGKTELTGIYKETYDKMMAQANEVIKKFIGEN